MPIPISDQEARLEQYLRAEQTDKAVQLLYQMAVDSARNKDFERAEELRDRLYEVDSMAISVIVKLNEIIEKEKSAALTPDRRSLWSRFFDGLSAEEANAFFFALQNLEMDEDQTVLQQGMTDERLFLVERGQLKVVHDNANKQILIRRLGTGDIFGEETFFSVNVCTASVITLSQVALRYMDRGVLERLRSRFPILESSLHKICCSGRTTYDWLRQKGADRRSARRINLHTKIEVQMLAPGVKNALQRTLTAELWDISKSGLSFYFQSKNKDAVRRLIGKTLGMRLNLSTGNQQKEVALTGIVQGVQNHPLDEYSVHVKLNRQFSDSAIHTLNRLADAHGSPIV